MKREIARKKVSPKQVKQYEAFAPEEITWLDRVFKKVFKNFGPHTPKKAGAK